MRLDKADDRSSQSDPRKPDVETNRQSQMPPARRAALDALEREFHDLLKVRTR